MKGPVEGGGVKSVEGAEGVEEGVVRERVKSPQQSVPGQVRILDLDLDQALAPPGRRTFPSPHTSRGCGRWAPRNRPGQ